VAVVAIMHELTLAARFCDRLVLLDKGRVVADGPPTAVLDTANLRAVYGIEAWLGDAGGERLIVPLRRSPIDATERDARSQP
jgi:iron complex transport system ATP-binding protein